MPGLGLTVVLDAPTEAGAEEGTWIQLAKQGKFRDPRYGEFRIDQGYFDKWLQNFEIHDADRGGVGIDKDHSPEKGEGTEATGWILALEQRGREMWGKVKWNSLGRQLIADARYRFLSPSYKEDFVDEEGNHHGTKLMGAALTNRPFLGMAAVTLSRLDTALESENPDDKTVVPSTADSPRQMDPKELAKTLGLPEDTPEDKILEAVAATKAKADAEPAKVDPEDSKTLAEAAKAQGMVILEADQVLQLQQDASEGKAAAATLREQRFTDAWGKALEAGKVTPAEEDTYKDLYEVAPDKTLSSLEARPKIVNTEANGSGGSEDVTVTLDGVDPDAPIDEESAELHGKVVTLMAAEPDLGYEQALDKVLAQGAAA